MGQQNHIHALLACARWALSSGDEIRNRVVSVRKKRFEQWALVIAHVCINEKEEKENLAQEREKKKERERKRKGRVFF